jgi:four helix bundle protein
MKEEPARTFEDLVVWRKAHELVLHIYRLTESFPKTEIYGLTSQLRRAAISIPANIAEGFNKSGRPDKLKFLNTAQGSLEECRYYFILATDLRHADVSVAQPLLEETSRLLQGYAAAIRRHLAAGAATTLAAVLSSCILASGF